MYLLYGIGTDDIRHELLSECESPFIKGHRVSAGPIVIATSLGKGRVTPANGPFVENWQFRDNKLEPHPKIPRHEGQMGEARPKMFPRL